MTHSFHKEKAPNDELACLSHTLYISVLALNFRLNPSVEPSSVLTVSCDENDNIINVGFVISIAKAEGCIINPPSLCQARTGIVIGIGNAKF